MAISSYMIDVSAADQRELIAALILGQRAGALLCDSPLAVREALASTAIGL